MRHTACPSRFLVPVLTGLGVLGILAGSAGCSRTDDRAGAPAAASDASAAQGVGPDAAPAAGGPSTLKPGLWKTVAHTPVGVQETTECVGEGYDPGAEAARKVSPCGSPEMTRTVDGFRVDLACEKDHIRYKLTGTAKGDFVTTARTEMELEISAFGRRKVMQASAVSTYQGACPEGAPTTGRTADR